MAKLAKESAADSAETVVFQFFNLVLSVLAASDPLLDFR